MAVEIRQPGEAVAAAKAGAIISRGKREEEERARAEREQARQAQEQARQAALEWEQKKMQMRSEQEFQQELADKQWDYEKFNRAKAWEIEKLEMVSRLDFEREEKARQEKINKWQVGRKAIEESTDIYLTQADKDKALFEWDMKHQTGLYPPRPTKGEAGSRYGIKLEEDIGEPIKGIETIYNPITGEPVYVPENQPFVNVQHPTRGLKKIRREQLSESMAEGSIYIPTQPGPIRQRKAGVWGAEALGMYGGI